MGGEHSKHYIDMNIDTWDVVSTWSIEQQIGFYRGNAMKYLMRMGHKDSTIQEARKAIDYCEKLFEVLTQKK